MNSLRLIQFIAIISATLFSCTEHHKGLPEYFAVHVSKQQHCIMVHASPSCNNSHMTLMPACEVYGTAVNRHGSWTIRYNDEPDAPMRFCAKCINEEQMSMIIDSIAAREKFICGDDIDNLMDELRTLKEIQKKDNRKHAAYD